MFNQLTTLKTYNERLRSCQRRTLRRMWQEDPTEDEPNTARDNGRHRRLRRIPRIWWTTLLSLLQNDRVSRTKPYDSRISSGSEEAYWNCLHRLRNILSQNLHCTYTPYKGNKPDNVVITRPTDCLLQTTYKPRQYERRTYRPSLYPKAR